MHPKYNITDRQREVYDFVVAYIEENDQAPTFREIAEGLDHKTLSNVHRMLHALRDRNWIDFLDNRARSIIIL